MKIISFVSRKGGVGKTTITYLISTYLSEIKNKRILLIDADPQGNLSSMFDLYENNTAILFSKNKFNLFKIIKKTSIKNLEIISSNIDLDEINNLILNYNIKQKVLFKNITPFFNQLKNNYDYILIDTNPSLNLINQNMLLISDEIILICDESRYSVKGIMNLISDWSGICHDFEIKNTIRTIILNRLENKSASKQIVDFMNREFSDIVLENTLREYAIIKNAINNNKTLSKNKSIVNLGNPIEKIVQELFNKKIL
ncbi:ParA family protein [Spiroplasma endosymbiont of Colias croceus]|uniref:ParA family protein n=1 Tax=Spiroplasma endosymbiont of Colias croceus TaxID=3066310 RepID=UPI0030CF1F9D